MFSSVDTKSHCSSGFVGWKSNDQSQWTSYPEERKGESQVSTNCTQGAPAFTWFPGGCTGWGWCCYIPFLFSLLYGLCNWLITGVVCEPHIIDIIIVVCEPHPTVLDIHCDQDDEPDYHEMEARAEKRIMNAKKVCHLYLCVNHITCVYPNC